MHVRAILAGLALLVLAAVGCRAVPNPDCPEATLSQAIRNSVENAKANPNGTGEDCGPLLVPLSAKSDGGTCPPADGDDDCVLCVKASCCSAGEACAEDPACEPGAGVFDDLILCAQTHCAKECPR